MQNVKLAQSAKDTGMFIVTGPLDGFDGFGSKWNLNLYLNEALFIDTCYSICGSSPGIKLGFSKQGWGLFQLVLSM